MILKKTSVDSDFKKKHDIEKKLYKCSDSPHPRGDLIFKNGFIIFIPSD